MWKPLSSSHIHGMLLGYKILYRPISTAGERLQNSEERMEVAPRNVTSVILTNLTQHTSYSIRVAAVTSGGDGVYSIPTIGGNNSCISIDISSWRSSACIRYLYITCLYGCMHVCMYARMYSYMCFYLSIFLSIYLFIYLSIYLFIYSSTYLLIY